MYVLARLHDLYEIYVLSLSPMILPHHVHPELSGVSEVLPGLASYEFMYKGTVVIPPALSFLE